MQHRHRRRRHRDDDHGAAAPEARFGSGHVKWRSTAAAAQAGVARLLHASEFGRDRRLISDRVRRSERPNSAGSDTVRKITTRLRAQHVEFSAHRRCKMKPGIAGSQQFAAQHPPHLVRAEDPAGSRPRCSTPAAPRPANASPWPWTPPACSGPTSMLPSVASNRWSASGRQAPASPPSPRSSCSPPSPRLVVESRFSRVAQLDDSEPYAGRASHMDRTQVECKAFQTAEGPGIRGL